eukprot:901411-Prymnesium_polylepis.1
MDARIRLLLGPPPAGATARTRPTAHAQPDATWPRAHAAARVRVGARTRLIASPGRSPDAHGPPSPEPAVPRARLAPPALRNRRRQRAGPGGGAGAARSTRQTRARGGGRSRSRRTRAGTRAALATAGAARTSTRRL